MRPIPTARIYTRPGFSMRVWLGAFFLFLLVAPAWAQDDGARTIKDLDHRFDQIERQLARGTSHQNELSEWTKQVNTIKSAATDLITKSEAGLDKVNTDLVSLGAPVKGASAEVSAKRAALERDRTELEKRIADCRLLILRSDDALQKISDLGKTLLARRLLARGPSLFELIRDNWAQPKIWLTSIRNFMFEQNALKRHTTRELETLIALLVAAFGAGFLIRRRLRSWSDHHPWENTLGARLKYNLTGTVIRYGPPLLFTLACAGFFLATTFTIRPLPFVSVVAYGLPVYVTMVALVHWLLVPTPPAQAVIVLRPAVARPLAHRLKVLLLLAFLGYLLFATLLTRSLEEPALLLAQGIFAGIFSLNLMWVLWLLGHIRRLGGTWWLRGVIYVALLGTVAIEWLGYRNLSAYILRMAVGTLGALVLLILALRALRTFFNILDYTVQPTQSRLRRAFGLNPGERLSGLTWLRFLGNTLVLIAFAFACLHIWELSETTLQDLQDALIKGFTVGLLHIVPARILLALIALAVLLAISDWFRARLESRWIKHSRMERGAREALVTVSGYAGTAIAVLTALGVAGVEFSHLAIIAGALSVGIGFGLQNIVNNFVSGLILLFERPIKTGDWIVVGNTEGYVKRIRIRSTQIQTFDRADVIVPNSELISTQVTNWMLYDARGRVRFPVSVAYGSETQKIKEILLDIADRHPQIITDGSVPKPFVLFRTFGDSALDFELRCHIQNIDNRLTVISDLNFAVDAAFRENNIEIPFPQRDIHIRDWPQNTSRDDAPAPSDYTPPATE